MTRRVEARLLRSQDRPAVLARLAANAKANLFLLDLTDRIHAPPSPGEMRTEIAAAWRGDEVVGVVGLRPSIAFDADVTPEAVEAFLPLLESLGVGLVKSPADAVDWFWRQLGRRVYRRALVDRLETAYCVHAGEARLGLPRESERTRCAIAEDLDWLVDAARESLREESRPDPFAGDVRGFRRWVRGRVPRARVVEAEGRVVFAGYADVQRPEGWLLQGVYTRPEARRRGYGGVGVSHLCREAFANGAEHVQLSVVDGNQAGRSLYESLGFKPFARLRTILFS
ncbi:MAG TPA: GNAT family N-acetyltransferase [Myxococcota bacterium]|jgi:ribosomal protein S18 acetylase RimI-like enzyme